MEPSSNKIGKKIKVEIFDILILVCFQLSFPFPKWYEQLLEDDYCPSYGQKCMNILLLSYFKLNTSLNLIEASCGNHFNPLKLNEQVFLQP